MENPFHSIIELTKQFEQLTDKSWRYEVAVQLAIAQQLAVISGRLKDISEALEGLTNFRDGVIR